VSVVDTRRPACNREACTESRGVCSFPVLELHHRNRAQLHRAWTIQGVGREERLKREPMACLTFIAKVVNDDECSHLQEDHYDSKAPSP